LSGVRLTSVPSEDPVCAGVWHAALRWIASTSGPTYSRSPSLANQARIPWLGYIAWLTLNSGGDSLIWSRDGVRWLQLPTRRGGYDSMVLTAATEAGQAIRPSFATQQSSTIAPALTKQLVLQALRLRWGIEPEWANRHRLLRARERLPDKSFAKI